MLSLNAAPVHLQVLERDGWTGLEEVTRLLNGHEFAVTGETSSTYGCTERLKRASFGTKTRLSADLL